MSCRQRRHRGFAAAEPGDHVAPDRIGERGKRSIEPQSLNHLVKY